MKSNPVRNSLGKANSIPRMTACALLIAVAIMIPMFFPKIVIPPASFTLASHVPIFIALMLSPVIGVVVAVGATAGYLLAGFPIVIVARAATHVVFAFFGGLYLKRNPDTMVNPLAVQIFAFVVALVHGLCEFFVILPFYFSGQMANYAESGLFRGAFILVMLGTVCHSMVDFEIAAALNKALNKQPAYVALRTAELSGAVKN